MIPGVTTNVLDFIPGFQKYMTHRVNNAKEPSRTSLYLEDVPELPDHHDVNHDTWSHHQCTGFYPRFPEIYDTLGQWCKVAIKKILMPGGCSWASWSSWCWSWWLESTLLYLETLADHFYVWIKSLAVLVPEILLFVTWAEQFELRLRLTYVTNNPDSLC